MNTMRLIVTEGVEKKAKKLGINFDDIYTFIRNNFVAGNCFLEELCSPIPGTVAYKGYMSGVHRIIAFFIVNNGIIYPVHIGDKRDPIARNITTDVVRRNTGTWQKEVLSDLYHHRVRIRHFT